MAGAAVMQRVRNPMRENHDVDLGPKPADPFAPTRGSNPYGDLSGELVVGDRIARHDLDIQREWKRAWRERLQVTAATEERKAQLREAARRYRARKRGNAA